VHRTGRNLGLDEAYYYNDDIDGVAIIDQPKIAATNYGTCE